MNLKKFLAIALLGGLTLVGCGDYNEDNFEGLDDVVKLENVQTLTYTLTESDYALMASKATSMASGEAAAALKSIGTLQAFSEEYPASEYVPYFLAYTGGEFFTLSDESSVKLTYNYQAETPENIKMLSQMTTYTLSADDYKEIWGSEEDFINGVSDSKLSKIASVIPTEEIAPGDYVVVTYNHAVAEPVFGSEEPEPEQPGEPEEPTNNYTSVLGSAALGDTVEVKGYVSAVCTQGIVVTDNTGSILVYKNTDFALGDVVTVSGPISSYNKGFQFDTRNGDITITKDGEVEVTYPEPMVIDGAKADELVTRSADEYLVFVKMTGTVSISGDGKYYNVAIEGATASQGSFYGITDEHKALVANGEVATIYGYLSSISSGKYVNIIATHINEEPTVTPGEPEQPTNNYTSVLGSAALGDTVEVKGYVSAVCTQGIVVTDNTGSILVYKNTDFALGDVVTVSGPISSYNKGFQFDTRSGNITITKDGEVEVTYPEPMVIDGAKADELVTRSADEYLVFVKMTGTVSISGDGKYYNVAIEGATASQGSFYGITDEHKALVANGEVATIYGYLSSISSGKYVNIIATKVEGATSTSALSTRAVISSPKTEKRYACYVWDGEKFADAGVTLVQPEDYSAMGQKYGNFTSPQQDKYLPQWLAETYPYAQAEDVKNVVYIAYVSGSNVWSVDQYTFNGSEWTKNKFVEEVTDQFVRMNGKWTYNPSVVLNLLPSKTCALSVEYYQAATDWVWDNIDVPMGFTSKGQGFVTSYGNNEYYTGCSAYYGNIDVRPGSARSQFGDNSYQDPKLVEAGIAFEGDGYNNLEDSAVVDLMFKRAQYVLGRVIEQLNPELKPVEGIDVTVTLNVGVFAGDQIAACTHSFIYQVVGEGEVEFVEMKTL